MTENSSAAVLSARNLTAILTGDTGDIRIIDDLTLKVAAGEIVDVVGASGCGKTTLLRALARLLPKATGELLLRGVPAGQIPPHEWRAAVALLPQKPAMIAGSVRDNLMLPWTLKVRHHQTRPSERALREALDELHLSGVSLERDTSRLSVGQQARIALLRVLLSQPSVLLLDEPDANLDEASAAQVTAATVAFAAAGGAVVRVRHQRTDNIASRRLSMCSGALTQVQL